MGDLPDVLGTISLGFQDGMPALTFRGPGVPGFDGVNPVMIFSYDTEARRARVRAGAATDDDSMTVDLTQLPEEMRNIVTGLARNRPQTVRIPAPNASALSNGAGGFLTYAEYQGLVRLGQTQARPTGVPFNPLDPAMLRRAAYSVIYPPLTRAIFDALAARARGRQMLGAP